MTAYLLLQPAREDEAWTLIARETGAVHQTASLDAAAESIADDDTLWLVLPGERAITRTLSLPMRSTRDVVRAADLALKDQCAFADEDLFIAYGAAHDGQRLVVGLEREALAGVLAEVQTAGLEPDLITVDHALLAPGEEQPVLWARGPVEAVRLADGGFSAEAGFAEAILDDAHKVGLTRLATDGLVDALDAEPPNFRRGPFAKRRQLPDLSAFRIAAALLLAAGTIYLMGVLVEGNRYARQASAMRDTVEAEFRAAFPGTPIVDLERQIRSRTNNTSGDGSFLPLSAALAEVLEGREDTSLTSLRYDDQGELAAEIKFQEFSDLEALREALGDRGVVAREAGDARREDESYVTQLYLRAA